jgi:hypothetical protein
MSLVHNAALIGLCGVAGALGGCSTNPLTFGAEYQAFQKAAQDALYRNPNLNVGDPVDLRGASPNAIKFLNEAKALGGVTYVTGRDVTILNNRDVVVCISVDRLAFDSVCIRIPASQVRGFVPG